MYFNILPGSSLLFSGREKELRKIKKLFSEINIFYIEGISGIGKTALMLKWANMLAKKKEYKERILWLECQEDWTLDKLLMEISNWLVNAGENIIRDYLKESSIKSEDKILYIINQLNKKNYVLFIDDFQNIKQNSSEVLINTLKHYIRNTRIYLISNKAFPLSPVEGMDIGRLRIKGLEANDSLLLIKKFFTFHDFRDVPEEDILLTIIDNSKGHPLYLKTFSGLLISRIATCNDIVKERYIEKDIGNIIFKRVINHLTDEEKMILELLSACRIPLSSKHIREISNLDNYSEILLVLESRMLIEKDKDCRYLIHPLLKDYIWKELPDTKRNNFHKVFGEYFQICTQFSGEAFYHFINGGYPHRGRSVLEQIMKPLYNLGYYEELMEKFEVLARHIALPEEMTLIKANILLSQGKWNESLAILEFIRDKITDENLLGNVYLSFARIYLNLYDFQKSMEFYNRSLEIFRKSGNLNNILKTLNRLAHLYLTSGEIDKASGLINESFSILRREPDELLMGDTLRIKSQILTRQKEYEEALETLEECLNIAKNVGSVFLTTRAFYDKSNIFTHLRRYEEAIKTLEDNLTLGKELGDSLIIAFSYMRLGEIFYHQGNMPNSREFVKKSLDIYRSMGNKMLTLMCEFNLANVYEMEGEFKRAFNLYSEIHKKSKELTFKKLEIASEVKTMACRLKIKELYPHIEEIFSLKERMPDDLIEEAVNLNFILSIMYLEKNKYDLMEVLLQEALELSEKKNYIYGIVKASYLISKVSNGGKDMREYFRKRAEEYFCRLTMIEKKELESLFDGIEDVFEKRFFVKTNEKEMNLPASQVEELRKKKGEFELFIDMAHKSVFERTRGEINIFKKKRILSLLLFLARNNKEISSEEIYKGVWGWEYEGEASETDVRKNICRLRELIEPRRDELKYILLKECPSGERGKYYFNDKIKFCLIDEF